MLSFLFYPIKPNLHINREYFKEVAKFGKGMFGLPFLTVICLQADVFVLGKMIPSETLGMYVLASSLAQQPAILFARTIGSVLLPAFSEKQASTQAIRNAFIKIIKVALIVGLPGATLAFLFSAPILSVIYGAQYSTMSTTFGVLCYAMLLHMFSIILGSIYIGVGKPQLHRYYMLLLTILILTTLYPGIRLLGTLGAALALLLSYVVATCVQFKWLHNAIGFGLRDFWWSFSAKMKSTAEIADQC
jgi:exopolysaccharide (amylovoran) exporter